MKKILFLSVVVAFFISCDNSYHKDIASPLQHDTIYVTDSIYLSDSARIKEVEKEIKFWKDSLASNTKISYEDYMNARRIEKIRYYIKITKRRPSNRKFFFGWICRTMSE